MRLSWHRYLNRLGVNADGGGISLSICRNLELMKLGSTVAMLEKLLLAFTITFCLNLFLGARLQNVTTTATRFQLAQTPKPLIRMLNEGFSTAIKRHNQTAFCIRYLLPPTRGS